MSMHQIDERATELIEPLLRSDSHVNVFNLWSFSSGKL